MNRDNPSKLVYLVHAVVVFGINKAFFIQIHSRICKLGWAKQDLWGLEAESKSFVASFPFAKMILPLGDHFGKRTACYNTP